MTKIKIRWIIVMLWLMGNGSNAIKKFWAKAYPGMLSVKNGLSAIPVQEVRRLFKNIYDTAN